MIDFLILGGGIAGLAAAAKLSPHGSLEVVEAESSLGYHATGRSAAMFFLEYGNSVIQEFNRASFTELNEIAHGKVMSDRRVLAVAGPGQTADFERTCESDYTHEITSDEARSICPILKAAPSHRFAETHGAMDVDTDLLLQTYSKIARQNGATIKVGAPITSIERTRHGWEVANNSGSTACRYLVNAAGAWADEIAQLAGVPPIGLQAYRRSIAQTQAPMGADVRNWPFLLGVAEDWFARPFGGSWLVSPAEEDPQSPHDTWADDMILAEGIARYEEMVTTPVTRVETSWAGLRTFAPDRSLVIGPDPIDQQFVWCAGQGGYGFQTSAAAARHLAATTLGQKSEMSDTIAAAVAPARFTQR